MMLRLSFGAKWTILALQLGLLLNAYLVTGVDDGFEDQETLVAMESRNPYIILAQREYIVRPNGEYEKISEYPSSNATAYEEEYVEDQAGANSIRTQTFESPYAKYSYGTSDSGDELPDEARNRRQSSIQEILGNRQGQYDTSGGRDSYSNTNNNNNEKGTTPSRQGHSTYNSNSYAGYPEAEYGLPGVSGGGDGGGYVTPAAIYDEPQNYFPGPTSDPGQFQQFPSWPQSYKGAEPQGALPLSGFLAGIGNLKASVKEVKTQIGEQKAKSAYQFADGIKNTGNAATQAILSKGHTAARIVGQTVDTAGNLLRSKGETATRLIQSTGQFTSNALRTAGDVGSNLIRTKGQFVGAVLKTGTALGGKALGKAASALNTGTYLIKAKGDAASNIIAKGGRLASGVIGTKGRLISSVINAKGQLVAQVIEAKGRAAATLLESGGQKLNQLAEAIKSATYAKGGGGGGGGNLNYGWSDPAVKYASAPTAQPLPLTTELSEEEPIHQIAEPEQQVIPTPAHQQNNNAQHYYSDAYYNPRDQYYNYKRNAIEGSTTRTTSSASPPSQHEDDVRGHLEVSDEEDILHNDYSSYYHPYHSQQRQHQASDYYRKLEWE